MAFRCAFCRQWNSDCLRNDGVDRRCEGRSHAQNCWCLNDSAECCVPTCPCHDDETPERNTGSPTGDRCTCASAHCAECLAHNAAKATARRSIARRAAATRKRRHEEER